MRQLDMGGRQILNLEPSLTVPAVQFLGYSGSTPYYEGPNLADVGVMIHSETSYSVGNNPNQPGLSYSDIRSSPTITGVTPAGNVEIYGASFTPTLAGTSAGGCLDYAGIAVNAVASGGTVTTGFAHRSQFSNNGATVTTAVVFDGVLLAISGTIGTSIGLRLTALGGSTVWGIQVGAYNNYFAGNSSFGATSTPSYPVDVTGSGRISASLLFGSTFPTTTAGGQTLSQNPILVSSGAYTLTPVSSEYYMPWLVNDQITIAGTATNSFIYMIAVQPSVTASTGTSGLTATGVAVSPTFQGTDTYGLIEGLSFSGTIKATATAATGVDSFLLLSTANTVTTMTMFKGHSLKLAGTITTLIGLDLTSLSGGSTTWGIQVGNYNNYFQGKSAFGGTSSPANTVDVQSGALNYNVDTMTYATVISLNVTLGNVHKTTTTSAGNATINASAGTVAGQVLHIIITNDASAQRTITFGANFKPTATLVGTISKTAVVSFVSDGTNYYEFARATGL